MKKERTVLPATADALVALGSQVAAARRDLGWTAADLAERLGVSRALVGRIERGAASTSIGTVLDAAVICGVSLYGARDADDLAAAADAARTRLALLPTRVRGKVDEVDDDF